MRNYIIPSVVLAVLVPLASGCKQTECAEGTIERDGKCEPAIETTDTAKCGPFTELQGDRCVPQFAPTECDLATTTPSMDPETGVVTCVGTGASGGCGTPLPCPASSGLKLTVCGQIYDFETNAPFASDTCPMGVRCPATPTATGPCALTINAYDALLFGQDPMNAPKLTVGDLYIDDCGRYRLTDIDTSGTGPFIGLGFDDAAAFGNPAGVTVTVGVATPKPAEKFVANFEAWIVKGSTAQAWSDSGGPPLAGGIYAAVYRQHKIGIGDPFANQAGVTITKSNNVNAANDHYFVASATDRTAIDTAANATGANGTALYTGASVADGVVYGGGSTGITDTAKCRWEPHAAASLPGIVFIQLYRKIDFLGQTCAE